MATAVAQGGWAEPSSNPGWTNGQLLFHVLLGFRLVLPLARLQTVFGHLPRPCSRFFAALLDLGTPLFHRINAFGPRAAARALGHAGVIRKFDQTHDAILERLEHVRPSQWTLTMHYPTRWDPGFRGEMRLEDVFAYPVAHLRHHRAQVRANEHAARLD